MLIIKENIKLLLMVLCFFGIAGVALFFGFDAKSKKKKNKKP